MAESRLEYGQPVPEGTDGSQEPTRHALSIAQMRWNRALRLELKQEKALLVTMRAMFKNNEAEFVG